VSANCEYRRRYKRLLAILIWLIFIGQITGCRKPTAQDMLGNWQVDFAKSSLKLKLNADGTFEETFENKENTHVVRRVGKWEMTELEGQSLVLNGPLVVRDNGTVESYDSNGAWILHVDKAFGHIRMPVNEDLNLYFDKVPN
jgi:hypothetical protein